MNTTPNTQTPNNFDANANMNAMPSGDNADKTMKDMPSDDKAASADMDKPDAKMGGTDMVKPDGQDLMTDLSANMKEKKDQLHRRVMARIAEIEKELSSLAGTAKDSDHAKALQTELSLANDAMSGGWDRVGEMEAARLSQWLDSSQNLLDRTRPDPASGEPMNTRLPADGAVATDGKEITSRPQTKL